MGHRSLIATIAFILTFCNTHAQNKTTAIPQQGYIFRHIDVTDGLLVNNVLAITQDHRGFIWLSTTKGLQRYDGLRFVNYNDTTDRPGQSNWASHLYPDANRNGLLVFKIYNRVKQLQMMQNEFVNPDTIQLLKKGGDNYTDWNGNIWTLRRNYSSEINKKGGTTSGHLLLRSPNTPYHYFAQFRRDSLRNETWIAALNYGWLLFDGKTRKVYSTEYNSIAHPLLKQVKEKGITIGRDIVMDSRGNIWLNNWGPFLYRFNTITQQLHTYSVIDISKSEGKKKIITATVNAILEDNHRAVWLATTNAGLLKYHPETDKFSYILAQQGNTLGIQYNFEINNLFQDKEENIWVGTDKGISIFNPYRQHFSIIQHDEYNAASLPKNEINAMIETSKGDLLIGTWGGGISVYDSQLRFIKNFGLDHVIQKNEIWCFIQNDDGTIWAGCQYGWIHIIDPDKLTLRTIHTPELDSSTIRCMQKDLNGNIWLGLHNGKIIQWNKAKKKFYPFHFRSKADSLSAPTVINLFIDHSQNFWVSTWNGLKQFDINTHSFIASYLPGQTAGAISSGLCHSIEEYNDSVLLIGTEDGGLNFFNKRTKAFSQPVINNDKSPSSVYAIKKDEWGNIWFTSNYAIYKLNPNTGKYFAYSPGNGVINSLFAGQQFLVTRSGQWFTWTYDKVVGFFPGSINEQEKNKTPVTITGFKVFNQPLLIDSLLYAAKPIELSYKQNFISIEFAAVQFSGNQQTEYYYRLSGIDKDWVPAGTKQFAGYTDLQPGEYIFSVKTGNDSNTAQSTSFTIIILPPFWQTWWFRTLCISFVAFLAYWLFRKRIKGIRYEAELKHKIAETEMMALRAQMNPHFIFNCLNAIDNMIQTNQKEKATTYLNRFAKLIRGVLDSSKNNLVPLHKDVEILKLYLQLEQFRCNNQFNYSLDVAPALLNGDYKIPPLIVQPFLENAIHHGLMNKETGNRCLEVSVQLVNDIVKYTIKDNGVGRTMANDLKQMNKPEHQSYGIQISTDRIMMHNNSKASEAVVITDLYADEKPVGTLIEVFVKADR